MIEMAAVVQVRMGSTRLPGKALRKVNGRPLLDILLARLQMSIAIDEVIVATTDLPEDDVIADHCRMNGHRLFRGDKDDVLLRYIGAAERFEIEHIVRVTGDNPLTDIQLMDELVALHRTSDAEYSHCIGYPLGTATEVVRSSALRAIHTPMLASNYREHVTLFFHDHQSSFKVSSKQAPPSSNPAPRLTVDTEDDLEMIIKLGQELGDLRAVDTPQVLRLLENRPDLQGINSMIVQKDPWKV